MKKSKLISKILCIFMLVFMLGLTFLPTQNTAYADEVTGSTIESLTDDKFTINVDTNGRKNTVVTYTKHAVTTKTGENIDYYCFKWRDISYFTFKFNANLRDQPDQYISYEFVAGSTQTEDLETSTLNMSTTTLLSGIINDNYVTIPNFHFYIDSDTQFGENASNKAKGTDFGIYRFDFYYTILEDDVQHKLPLGSFYFAIIPDDIDELSTDNLTIKYSVSSSNKLMSVYNLYLSAENSFRYVNPAFIEWTVIGKDRNNVNYVLTDKTRQSSPLYANYHVIWTSQMPTSPNGPTFVFDSNDIEGTWTAYCTIKYASTQTERLVVASNELSTLKVPKKSYVWLILLTSIGFLLVGSGTFLVVYKKRKG